MNLVSMHADLNVDTPEGAAAALRTTTVVRAHARQLLRRARGGASRWFSVHDDALQAAAVEVADMTRVRYPDHCAVRHQSSVGGGHGGGSAD